MQESIFRDEDDLLQIIQKQINIVIERKVFAEKSQSSSLFGLPSAAISPAFPPTYGGLIKTAIKMADT